MIPEADWAVDAALVEALCAAQFPQARGRVRAAGSGWDNAMFRVGDDWAVRLPRRATAVPLIEKEHRWLPVLAPRLTLAVPTPVHRGHPSELFPWPWTVQPWVPGLLSDQVEPNSEAANALGAFWKSLHRDVPTDAPVNPFRGGPLVDRVEAFEGRLARLAPHWRLSPVLRAVWNEALAAPLDLEPCWIHGDLHPRNVLVVDGRLSAVLDWGDLAAGDPATDLASAWMILPHGQQLAALEAYGGVSDATLARALGWATVFGVMFLDAARSDPSLMLLGRSILDRVERFGAVA